MIYWLRKNPVLGLGVLLSPLLLWIGFISAGFGHGNYIAARLIFPFACLFTGTYVGAGVVVLLLVLCNGRPMDF
jgi:hypothetical protein